jgi:hypothetical protein
MEFYTKLCVMNLCKTLVFKTPHNNSFDVKKKKKLKEKEKNTVDTIF